MISVEDDTFRGLGKLKQLIFGYNPLASIGEFTLNGLISMKKLSFHDGMGGNSKLTSIDRKAFKILPVLEEVQLPRNKFNASYFESFDLNGRNGKFCKPWSAYWDLYTIN